MQKDTIHGANVLDGRLFSFSFFFRFEIPWHHWCGAFVKYLRDMSDVDVKIRRDNIMRNIELLYTHLLLWKYTLCLPMVFTHAVSILLRRPQITGMRGDLEAPRALNTHLAVTYVIVDCITSAIDNMDTA
jgi:hypothetical protein